jgi:hypothetical protein
MYEKKWFAEKQHPERPSEPERHIALQHNVGIMNFTNQSCPTWSPQQPEWLNLLFIVPRSTGNYGDGIASTRKASRQQIAYCLDSSYAWRECIG